MTAEQLRAALAVLGVSQVTAARWLDKDPRTMRRYVLGTTPVPHAVAAAVRDWLAEHKRRHKRREARARAG